MRRRTFLKLVGLTSVAAVLSGSALASAASTSGATGSHSAVRRTGPSSLSYRGRNGRIFVSANGGRSWKHHTNLGPDYRVSRVDTNGSGGATATIGYAGRSFALALSPNLRSWLTA